MRTRLQKAFDAWREWDRILVASQHEVDPRSAKDEAAKLECALSPADRIRLEGLLELARKKDGGAT